MSIDLGQLAVLSIFPIGASLVGLFALLLLRTDEARWKKQADSRVETRARPAE